MSRQEKQWYEIVVNAAHQGSGKDVPTIKFVFAEDALAARDRLDGLRGWKRSGPINVRPMGTQAAELLERIIPEYTGLKLSQAKQAGVHASRLDTGVDLSVILQQMLAQQEINS